MTIKKLTAIVLTGALLLLTACSDSDSGSVKKSKKKDYYTIGETWTVDGQWSLTITGVTETAERNEYADEKPAAVYIVDYEYTNIGYEDEDGIAKGIFFDMEDTIIDSNGVMGYSYPGDVARNPNEAPARLRLALVWTMRVISGSLRAIMIQTVTNIRRLFLSKSAEVRQTKNLTAPLSRRKLPPLRPPRRLQLSP